MSFDYTLLKARHRAERDGYSQALSLRVHRALSWLDRAERETEDGDARFIFLWIAFNAAFGHEIEDRKTFSEQRVLGNFLKRLIDDDDQRLLYQVVWEAYPGPIRVLIDNPYVFAPFWEFQNNRMEEDEWRERFAKSRALAHGAIGDGNARGVLLVVFERLYTLRNQLIHGGATWNGRVNRDQIRDSAAIMDALVPCIIHLMMNHPNAIWGDPTYPVVSA